MLALLLKILSVLGIILLLVLCVLLLFLLLVLFFPVSYQIQGKRRGSETYLCVKGRWLFGALRLAAAYPEPGNLKVKLLWITLFDSASGAKDKASGTGKKEKETAAEKTVQTKEREEYPQAESHSGKSPDKEAPEGDFSLEEHSTEKSFESFAEKLQGFILAKYEKILYTFQGFYDKIKHIWENISYYKAILQEKDTRLLLAHFRKRAGKILKAVKPRRIKADILFGTGSPDTTGYVFGIYGMLSPHLGKDVAVTADFGQAVLEGELSAAGRITTFCILRNGLLLAMDKRLWLLIEKLKAGRTKNGR
ncbi:hypothetical protein [Candidatus Acetatifactor stercoripullorum]|uniref:hypothetical protein n=1 Tax=Candidatus Acetatifactor stercoripullorum TaxID=2838414 RepID=UPI00298DE1B9|nr:hypothetical protein [Candidatus Acetatifactor stercoripullorum]